MSDPLVLVVTSQPDTHINAVGEHLARLGVEWIRLNTEDLFTNTTIDVSPRESSGQISIADSRRVVEIRDVQAVWYRKPETPSIAHLSVAEDHERRFFEAESYESLLSLYAVLQDRPWINNPLTTRLAFRRFYQLTVASRLGMRTARSIYSNDEEAILRFADDVDSELALKSLGAMSVSNSISDNTLNQYGVLTRTISREDLYELRSNMGVFPTFVQEYIHKTFDLRVVVIGDRIFACRIHSQDSEVAKHDFRIATKGLEHELITLPDHLLSMIREFMESLSIEFGCFDFLEVDDGDPYFLECNPNGQWLWIEERTGAPIASAIADHVFRLIEVK